MLEAFKIKLHTIFMKYRRGKKSDPKKTFINPYSTEIPTRKTGASMPFQKKEEFDPVKNNPFRQPGASNIQRPPNAARSSEFLHIKREPVESVTTTTIIKPPTFVQDMKGTASDDILWVAGLMHREKKKVEEKKITADQILAACNSLNTKQIFVVTDDVESLFED